MKEFLQVLKGASYICLFIISSILVGAYTLISLKLNGNGLIAFILGVMLILSLIGIIFIGYNLIMFIKRGETNEY